MFPKANSYAIYPAVVQANKETEMIIAPAERSFMLYEGEEYEVRVIPVDADYPSYSAPAAHVILHAVAKDGVLRFIPEKPAGNLPGTSPLPGTWRRGGHHRPD